MNFVLINGIRKDVNSNLTTLANHKPYYLSKATSNFKTIKAYKLLCQTYEWTHCLFKAKAPDALSNIWMNEASRKHNLRVKECI
jgi:hypothetical protein